MARWRLTQPHHLNVPGTKWEYIETDRKTGRPRRTEFSVPLYLHPQDTTYWTEVIIKDEEGYINVCHEDKGQPNDIVFLGEPTPDMMPLDDEAREISSRHKWSHPIDSLPAQGTGAEGGYAERILYSFQQQLSEAMTKNAASPATVQVEGVSDMMAAMTKVMEQNAMLLAAIVGQSKPAEAPAPASSRRSA